MKTSQLSTALTCFLDEESRLSFYEVELKHLIDAKPITTSNKNYNWIKPNTQEIGKINRKNTKPN